MPGHHVENESGSAIVQFDMSLRFSFSAPLLLTLWTTTVLVGPALAETTNMLPNEPGIHERVSEAEGLDLRWAVDVPKGLDESSPRPLVLALHYGFDRRQPFPEYYGRGFLERVVAPGLRGLGAVIVAPDSHGHGWSNPAIAGPVLEWLDALIADPRIDGTRVVVTGYSMGGAGTWWFVAEHGDRFAAAIPMASYAEPPTARRAAEAVPLYVIHSPADTLIDIDPMRKTVKSLRAAGTEIEFVEVEDIPHFQSPRFAEPLREAIPWLERTFRGAADSDS